MEVIEHHAQRLRRATARSSSADGLEQQEALGLRIGGLRRGRVRNPAGEVARQPADLAAVALRIVRRARRPVRARPAASRPRSTAHTAPPDPRARTPADREPVRVRAERRIGRQPGSSRYPARPTAAPAAAHPTAPGCARPRSSPRSSSRPTYAIRGTVRSASGSGHAPHRPRTAPDPAAPTEPLNASTGSGIPFSSSSPKDSNRAPSTRPPANFVAGETRIPSAGASSHNRAASIDGIPK